MYEIVWTDDYGMDMAVATADNLRDATSEAESMFEHGCESPLLRYQGKVINRWAKSGWMRSTTLH